MKRETYKLTNEERKQFNQLKSQVGVALNFWYYIAKSRGLDYKTIIYDEDNPGRFSALSLDHGKHWCWPIPLQCKVDPKTVVI